MPKIINTETFTISAGGGTVLLPISDPTEKYRILPASGAVTLGANQTFSPSGTPVEGMEYEFEYNGSVTIGGNTLDIFGHVFTAAEALAKYIITATFISGQFEVKLAYSANDGTPTVDGSNVQAGTITSTELATGGIARLDIEDFTGQGFMLKGGASGVVEEFDPTSAGVIVVGQGADVAPKAMSGDATLAATGALTVANGAITPDKLSFTIESQLSATINVSSAQILALNTTPIVVVGAPGAGKIIEVISATAYITFNSAGYTGSTNIDLECQGAGIRQFTNAAIIGTTVTKGSQFLRETSAIGATITQLVDNAALILIQPTSDPVNGDSGMTLSVNYRIVNI